MRISKLKVKLKTKPKTQNNFKTLRKLKIPPFLKIFYNLSVQKNNFF